VLNWEQKMKATPVLLVAVLSFATSTSSAQKRDVRITTRDGVTIAATYFSSGKTGPGIILFHQCSLDRHSWGTLGLQLAETGYNVLAYDEPGFGDSQGGPVKDFDTLEETEKYWREKWSGAMEAVYQHLVSTPGVNKNEIGTAGASCGVYMSLLLAQAHPEQIKTLVLLSGPVDSAGIAFVAGSNSLPIFGSASEEDNDYFAWVKGIVAASKNPESKFIAYKDAGHGTKMFQPEPELPGLILEWFKTHLPVRNAVPIQQPRQTWKQ
jgi:pimeloyl-ACP methyl ester carboxylesterase